MLVGAEAATKVQHALVDELRQQTADAAIAHQRVVTSAEVEFDLARRALSSNGEGAIVQFDELRSELSSQVRKAQ